MECATVDQSDPDWAREIRLIKGWFFTPDSLMFRNAMGFLQDPQRRNVFYFLDRHGLARVFDLSAALAGRMRNRVCPLPTEFDLKSCNIEPPWLQWHVEPELRISAM